ncbi:hypothetical protein R3X27_07570 [Tropicimonas sp. TH_r6]|uniref:hypothetical protein n=1 Tax=Tropicimonas sp. TH_r6 TaxID=3082085 RepID=UPI0029552E38|nr:hypothetical protein [Tropicimonas sp. TH_r6]MDV7142540.1 hypothetical protein [Tropicimonas sp. TH_r6]
MFEAEALGARICDELCDLDASEKREAVRAISGMLMEFVAVNAVQQRNAEEAREFFRLADEIDRRFKALSGDLGPPASGGALKVIEGGKR